MYRNVSEKFYIVKWVCGLVTCFDEKFRVQWTHSEYNDVSKQACNDPVKYQVITPEELDELCGYHKVVFEPNTLSRIN